MGKYRSFLILALLFACWSCKKDAKPASEGISVEHVFVASITNNQIDISYNLSSFGYETTGVIYYKKGNPSSTMRVPAIRTKEGLKLSLQDLSANTEYAIKVYFKVNGAETTDSKEYKIKTLSEEAAKFAFHISGPSISYDDQGNFSLEIEGENLQNINLSQLEFTVMLNRTQLQYPVHISGTRYRIVIQGTFAVENMNYPVQATYQGKEVFWQSVPFVYNGDRYWMNLELTSLRGYPPSVFQNELYYFYGEQVVKWNDPEQRMSVIEPIPPGNIDPYLGLPTAFEFNEKLFFPPIATGYAPNPANISDYYNYPQGCAYEPATSKWAIFAFKEYHYPKTSRTILNSEYFTHKGELYLTFSIMNSAVVSPGSPSKIDDYLYHYNKTTERFDKMPGLGTPILNYHFISINNQLYLLGLKPVYDQGYKLSATFAIFKITDQFTLEPFYQAGTDVSPERFNVRYVYNYNQKILLAVAADDYKIFDLTEKKLYQVYVKNSISSTSIRGLFNYNNKHHIFADQKVYEISINKGR